MTHLDLASVAQGDIIGTAGRSFRHVVIVTDVDERMIRGIVINGQYDIEYDRLQGLGKDVHAGSASRIVSTQPLPTELADGIRRLNDRLGSLPQGNDLQKAYKDNVGDLVDRAFSAFGMAEDIGKSLDLPLDKVLASPASPWTLLRSIGLPEPSMTLEEVDKILDAALETVADVIPSMSSEQLAAGGGAAKWALHAFAQANGVDLQTPSPEYIAGRLSAMVDTLYYASFQVASSDTMKILEDETLCDALVELSDGPVGVLDTKISKEAVGTLRSGGVLTSTYYGRDLKHQLTPVGKQMAEQVLANRSSPTPR